MPTRAEVPQRFIRDLQAEACVVSSGRREQARELRNALAFLQAPACRHKLGHFRGLRVPRVASPQNRTWTSRVLRVNGWGGSFQLASLTKITLETGYLQGIRTVCGDL